MVDLVNNLTAGPPGATARAAGDAAAALPGTGGPSSGADIASDFETFLKLLTTQMRNQDPLKPIDSTEFVAQLAQFSAVEQQVQSNEKLTSIESALNGGAGAGLSEWIGKELLTDAAARFDGEGLTLEATPAADAKRAVLVISDAAEREVGRLAVDPAATSIDWAGETDSGDLGPGSYRFAVEYFDEEAFLERSPARTFDRATEVRLGPDGAAIRLAGGGEVREDDVVAVRAPADD